MKLIMIAAAVVFAVYLALPSFFLKKAVGKETLDAVTERLGQPLLTAPKPEGRSVNTYRVGSHQPLCVDYIITFEPKVLDDGTTLKPVIREWTWKLCGLP